MSPSLTDPAWRELARAAATCTGRDALLPRALPIVAGLAGASAVLVVAASPTGPQVLAATDGHPTQPALPAGVLDTPPGPLAPFPSDGPPLHVRRLPGDRVAAVLVGPLGMPDQADEALDVLAGALARLDVEERLADLTARVDNAQQLADMGDYDWHIATDTNRWSDQLYRIYGYEPQAFNASYDRFIEHIHPDDRDRIMAIHQRAYATGEPYQMIERIVRPDGETRYLASNGQVVRDESGTPVRMRGTCIDVTERVRAEQAHEARAVALREAQVRRRQALEINDNVVQGLTAAVYAMRGGDPTAATRYLDRTLAAARRLMNDWLTPLDGADLAPGDLVRDRPSSLGEPPPAPEPDEPSGRVPRLLVVDDNDDIRRLLRAQLAATKRFDVVGEAADGEQAIEAARELQPDVVILDLAMPRLDGLQALPMIRAVVPGVQVIVLSGFDQSVMARRALAAGAARYVEKGLRMDLPGVIDEVLAEASVDA